MIINGQVQEQPYSTVLQIISEMNLAENTLVVLINGQIVEAKDYQKALNGTEIIEVISFVTGG